MKKIIMTLLVVVAVTSLTTRLSAQYTIPSFNVPVVADPTSFEETGATNFSYGANSIVRFNHLKQKPSNRERRKMKVAVSKTLSKTQVLATVMVYSLDEQTTLGPYPVVEGIVLEVVIDERDWGVKVVSAIDDCELSVWIE